MEEKDWKNMTGWEKVREVTQITFGIVLLPILVIWWLVGKGGQSRSSSEQGGSVWPVGGGGKKPGSWSSGRHK